MALTKERYLLMLSQYGILTEVLDSSNNEEFILDTIRTSTLFFNIKQVGNSCDFESISDLGTVRYKGDEYLAAHTEKGSNLNIEMNFDEYSEIVMNHIKVRGIVINPNRNNYFLTRQTIRYMLIKEKVYNESNHEIDNSKEMETYSMCLQDIRNLWIAKEYIEQYEYLTVMLHIFHNNTGEILYYLGMTSETLANFELAEKLYREAINTEPNNYWLFYQFALFNRRIGNCEKELHIYETAYKKYMYTRVPGKEYENNGIRYILNALIELSEKNGKRRLNKRYKKTLSEYCEKYSDLENHKVYDVLGIINDNLLF